MSVFEDDSATADAAAADPTGVIRALMPTAGPSAETEKSMQEGADICEILAPLGLPAALHEAVRLYPLARDGALDVKAISRQRSKELADLVTGLVQLGQFTLPGDWRPGEALATQQSEALRKMLLAVVSDARLVVAPDRGTALSTSPGKKPGRRQAANACRRDAGDLCAARQSTRYLAIEMGARRSFVPFPGTGPLQGDCQSPQ